MDFLLEQRNLPLCSLLLLLMPLGFFAQLFELSFKVRLLLVMKH